ncbi:MAG: YeiH family protein [Candidatus Velthaea sp.]
MSAPSLTIARPLPRVPWLPGLLTVAAIAAFARMVSAVTVLVPDVVVALVAGIVLNNTLRLPAELRPGIRFVLRWVLRAAIIGFGAGLSLRAVLGTGGATLMLVVAVVTTSLALGLVFARVFGFTGTVGTLIGAGTAICGGSAILAIGPMLDANDEEIAYALTTIFTFNIIALVVYPPLGHALGLSAAAFGTWAGTAINDTSVVVATGYLYSHEAGNVATIVKLTRTVLLVPLALAIGIATARGSSLGRVRETIPWFVVGFVVMAALNSARFFAPPVAHGITASAAFLIVMVLAAVGLSVDVAKIRAMGMKPLAIGLLLAALMSGISLALVRMLAIA